jgi:hypothetical protein
LDTCAECGQGRRGRQAADTDAEDEDEDEARVQQEG